MVVEPEEDPLAPGLQRDGESGKVTGTAAALALQKQQTPRSLAATENPGGER